MRFNLQKREETKGDGRRIIYYTFVPLEEKQEVGREQPEREGKKHEQAAG